MSCFKDCRRKHEFTYELGLRPVTDSRALRMGSAFHDGIAALGRGESTEAACQAAGGHYEDMPDAFDLFDWLMERETVLRFVCAYEWRWANMRLEYVAVEGAFQLPLVNPATGKATPSFDLAGKIDGIVRLEDGRLAVKESKFLGEDVGQGAPLWRRLRMDQQISLYIHAARQAGYAVDTVLYDVARKPSIEPTPVPLLDSDGFKVVLDQYGERVRNANGKAFRQTSDKEKGYELQTRPMTTLEWGTKLTDDICSRPDFYFARVEIPRLDQDVAAYQAEVWDIQLEIREAQRTGRHYRTVGRSCQFCPYFDLCSTNSRVIPGRPPEGFEFVTDLHPELERKRQDDRADSTPASETANPAPAEAYAEC